MGDIKIGNNTISSAYFGNTEIMKIYVGSVKVYEKITSITATAYAGTISNCNVDVTFPYSFTDTTTINITPICNDDEWSEYDLYEASRYIDSSSPIPATIVNTGTPSISVTLTDPTITSVFFNIKHNRGTFVMMPQEYSANKTASASSASSNINLGTLGVGMTYTYNKLGRYMRVVGEIGEGNALLGINSTPFDSTVQLATNTTTITSVTINGVTVALRNNSNNKQLQLYVASRNGVALTGYVKLKRIILY